MKQKMTIQQQQPFRRFHRYNIFLAVFMVVAIIALSNCSYFPKFAPIITDRKFSSKINADKNGFIVIGLSKSIFPSLAIVTDSTSNANYSKNHELNSSEQYSIDLFNTTTHKLFRLRLTANFPDHFGMTTQREKCFDSITRTNNLNSFRGFQLPPGQYVPRYFHSGSDGSAIGYYLIGDTIEVNLNTLTSLGMLYINNSANSIKTINNFDIYGSGVLNTIIDENCKPFSGIIKEDSINWRFELPFFKTK